VRRVPEPIIEIKNLSVYFYTYAGVVKAIENVSFDIYRGETLALVGETGCGKSVTSRALTQLIESPGRIVSGQVLYHRDDG
jgi:peptide/nickel transport system ATP-binding protein